MKKCPSRPVEVLGAPRSGQKLLGAPVIRAFGNIYKSLGAPRSWQKLPEAFGRYWKLQATPRSSWEQASTQGVLVALIKTT
jgi:hypothetical protein